MDPANRARGTAHRVARMCRVLGVSPSVYYAWRKRGLSRRRREDAVLLERVRRIWEGSGRTYGAPRAWAELRACGVRCSGKREAPLMRGAGRGLPPEAAEEHHGAGPGPPWLRTWWDGSSGRRVPLDCGWQV
jgi:transposase InsO family protein